MRNTSDDILCLCFGSVQGTGHFTGFQKSPRCSRLATKFLPERRCSGHRSFRPPKMANTNVAVQLLKSNLGFQKVLRCSRLVTKFVPERLTADHLALLPLVQPLQSRLSQDLLTCGFPRIIFPVLLSVRRTPLQGSQPRHVFDLAFVYSEQRSNDGFVRPLHSPEVTNMV
jgi:hypothetical protein